MEQIINWLAETFETSPENIAITLKTIYALLILKYILTISIYFKNKQKVEYGHISRDVIKHEGRN